MKFQEGSVTADFSVIGYQFPELHDQSWDSDWLLLHLRLQVGEHVWEHSDPAVTTFELLWLADWMEEVASQAQVFGNWQHQRLTTRIFFTEPNLGFEALSGHLSGAPMTWRLFLGAEYLPPFKAALQHDVFETDPSEVWVDFGMDGPQLYALAKQLREQLAPFPVRVGL